MPQSGAQFKFQAEDKWAPEWGLELSVVLLATFYSVYCYCFYFVCCLCWLNCDHTFVSTTRNTPCSDALFICSTRFISSLQDYRHVFIKRGRSVFAWTVSGLYRDEFLKRVKVINIHFVETLIACLHILIYFYRYFCITYLFM